MSDLAEHLFKTAKAMTEVQMVNYRREEARVRDLLCVIQQLRAALGELVASHEICRDESDGRYPLPDCGCLECTKGTVPDHLNTGLCAYHHAKRLLES